MNILRYIYLYIGINKCILMFICINIKQYRRTREINCFGLIIGERVESNVYSFSETKLNSCYSLPLKFFCFIFLFALL